MIVIGADTHKHNHTLVAVDGLTGATRGQLQIAARDEGAFVALRFAIGLDEQRVWAIEDCRHVSGRLEAASIAAGERVERSRMINLAALAPGLDRTGDRSRTVPGIVERPTGLRDTAPSACPAAAVPEVADRQGAAAPDH